MSKFKDYNMTFSVKKLMPTGLQKKLFKSKYCHNFVIFFGWDHFSDHFM